MGDKTRATVNACIHVWYLCVLVRDKKGKKVA